VSLQINNIQLAYVHTYIHTYTHFRHVPGCW